MIEKKQIGIKKYGKYLFEKLNNKKILKNDL